MSSEFHCGACNSTLEYVPWRLKVANGIPILGSLLVGDFLGPRAHALMFIAVVLATFTVLSLLSWLLLVRLHVKAVVS